MNLVYGQPIDYVVLGSYFVFILVFGSFFSKYSKTSRDFFFSGQRFSWWLIALSCVSMVVGSYSFIKYSSVGYSNGLSSTTTYLNDWFLAPLFMFGWMPLIYYSRVTSIPEYFEKRFDRWVRIMAMLYILFYLIVSIATNLYTMGVALAKVIPMFDIFWWAFVVAVVTGLYCAFGGQAAVIMTDLAQAILLLLAGLIILGLGLYWLGAENGHGLSGLAAFWQGLPETHRLPFSGFTQPANFPMVGIFWQDFFGASMLFYFANQGLIMRFLATKSVNEGRRAIIANILVLMPLAAISVSSAGWVGKSLETYGILTLPAGFKADDIFVTVIDKIAPPGIFGFILAALVAALMSTIDALINAIAAIAVNDIYRPYLAKKKSDAHYLTVARISSLLFTFTGLALVPVYMKFTSIYHAHATFTAALSPPLIVVVILGIVWKRFSGRAALATMVLGGVLMIASVKWPVMIMPFAWVHGMEPGAGYDFLRGLFGMTTCTAIAVIGTLIWPNRDEEKIRGLWVGTIQAAKRIFKGRETNDLERGEKVRLTVVAGGEVEPDPSGTYRTVFVTMTAAAAEKMKAKTGDLIYISDPRWWLGGLHSLHATLKIAEVEAGEILIPEAEVEYGGFKMGSEVTVEKIL